MREKESETGEMVRGGLKMSVENESQRLTQGRERERETRNTSGQKKKESKKGKLSQTHL